MFDLRCSVLYDLVWNSTAGLIRFRKPMSLLLIAGVAIKSFHQGMSIPGNSQKPNRFCSSTGKE